MFLRPELSRLRKIQREFRLLRSQTSWPTLATYVLGLGGILGSFYFSRDPASTIPWHFSLAIFFLICLHAHYVARYYKIKASHLSPQRAFLGLHKIAESIRTLESNADFGKVLGEQNAKEALLEEYRIVAREICNETKVICNALGVGIERVHLKLIVKKRIYVLGSSLRDENGPDLEGVSAEENPFWNLFFKVHTHYERIIRCDAVRAFPGNKNLQPHPRFLAIDHLDQEKPHEPMLWEVISTCIQETKKAPPQDAVKPKQIWEALRNKIDNRYNCCIGVMICGPLSFGEEKPSDAGEEFSRKDIGFIGLDATAAGALDALKQSDIDPLGVIADSLFFPMEKLIPLYEQNPRLTSAIQPEPTP